MVRLQPSTAKSKSGSVAPTPRKPRRHTLAVIDAGVDNYQHLVAGITPGVEVLVLDSNQDGIEQITQALKTYRNITTLHIIAHGAAGCLMLGNTQLNLTTLDRYAWDLTSWFPSPHVCPAILLYACHVAAGELGTTFLKKLRHLTEAEIAASTTPIGNVELGGNWELDVITGAVEVSPVFRPDVLATYPAILNNGYHKLSTGTFTQYWSETGLITAEDDWSSVPSIVGYRGDGLTVDSGTDPQTIVADGTSTPVDVIANQNSPNNLTTGGIAEFSIANNPTIAMQGSGTADAPFLLIHLDTTGANNVQVSYKLRDIDGSSNNAISQVALQYRIGETGDFINLPAGYVADASTGSAATQITPIKVALPSTVDNQSKVQLRIITANASGSDEWIGVDDIEVAASRPNQAPILTGSATLVAISEDADNTTNTGSKITDLINGLSTDANSDPQAIAVTGADNSNGTWQYSISGGATWIDFGNTLSDSNAVILGATSLYNAPLGTAPASQGWLAFANVVGATETVNSSGTVLDTTASNTIYAGYSNYNGATLVNPNFPILDNEAGYSISFNLQMLTESRTNQSRAGFSIVATSNDATKAIELGFQLTSSTTGNIFAQSPTFAAVENVTYNTNLAANYTLKVTGNTYQLLANGAEILTGSLRDYSGFSGPIDPYKTPNFIFLGDDTTSAQGRFNLSQVVVQTDTRVRFVPNPDYNGTANISFRAWDTTNGLANGNTNVNVTVNGSTTAYSAATNTAAITINPVNDAPVGNVIIDGTAQENQILTVNTASLSDSDGLGAFSYQWQSGDGSLWTDIAGATNSSFTPNNSQVGSSVRVRLTYTDQQGTPETVDSLSTAAIAGDSGMAPIDNSGSPENGTPNQPGSGGNVPGSDTVPVNAIIIETGSPIRETSTNQVTIRFSEAVNNFDLNDLVLLRESSLISLAGATLTTTDNMTWILKNLGSLTTADGRYQLTLKQSNITDLVGGNKLAADVTTTWLMGRTGTPLPQIRFKNGKTLGVRRLGNEGNSRLIGTPFNDVLKGGAGNDLIISGFGKAQFGVDRLMGSRGNDRLISGRGNDILSGGSGNDWIKAGKGDDLLQGGAGNDRLMGNSGRDTFVYENLASGTDTIIDFEETDLLDLRLIFARPEFSGNNAFARFFEFVNIEQSGANVKVNVDGNGNGVGKDFVTVASLQNITLTEISANNFLIA